MNPTGEWSIQQLARIAGTTSRTLRHYDSVGLLTPSRIGTGGDRHYDQAALVRLQRILLLRELGLGLTAIAEVLAGDTDPESALATHLELLEEEQERLRRRIASVRTTLDKMRRGESLMAEEMFDGFDHTRYEEEVVERWGRDAYDRSDSWWRSLSDADKAGFQQDQLDIAAEFGRAHAAGLAADSPEAQDIARRHYDWVAAGWQGRRPTADAFAGLGEMYVSDPRFAKHYDRHGRGTAEFVRDAMLAFALNDL
ncbi:TipAS antibiotic-recognition domain-containing protein [Rhodococcus sp. PAM 2766]|uniref:TipAS antibiotic-recognition domain-containing protein n=1 Tax=Rhodococcus parequi TaxID=3137122 RepID=A0ABW9FLS8_9NOCA